ncbi:hypothetical protein L7F22_003915 [Adiantum nelumboides]|nr:hypothetical protein [Adiantum nelumboides]
MPALGSCQALVALSSDVSTSINGSFGNIPQSLPMSMEEDPSLLLCTSPGNTGGSQVNWRLQETLILVEAKKEVELKMLEGGISVCVKDKWHLISDMCKEGGVSRSKSQCKSKWEKIPSTFNRIHDFEQNPPLGSNSYWQMSIAKRHARCLSIANFPMEVYEKMVNLFGGDWNVDLVEFYLTLNQTMKLQMVIVCITDHFHTVVMKFSSICPNTD